MPYAYPNIRRVCAIMEPQPFSILVLRCDKSTPRSQRINDLTNNGDSVVHQILQTNTVKTVNIASLQETNYNIQVVLCYNDDASASLPKNPFCDHVRGNMIVRAFIRHADDFEQRHIPISYHLLFPQVHKLLQIISIQNRIFQIKQQIQEVFQASLPRDKHGDPKVIMTAKHYQDAIQATSHLLETKRALHHFMFETADFSHLFSYHAIM